MIALAPFAMSIKIGPFVSKSQRKLNTIYDDDCVWLLDVCACASACAVLDVAREEGIRLLTMFQPINTAALCEHTNSCTMHKWAGSRLSRLSVLTVLQHGS